MVDISSADDYAKSSLQQDFNLEYSFEVSDLTADNFSEKNLGGFIGEDLIENDVNLTDVGNSTDIGNLAALCGLTITNQSLKIVQVNCFLIRSHLIFKCSFGIYHFKYGGENHPLSYISSFPKRIAPDRVKV